MRVNNEAFLPATSGASSFNSLGYPLTQVAGFYVQAIITGSLNGTLSLQTSGDPTLQSDPSYQPSNWSNYPNSSQTVSAAGVYGFNVTDVFFTWVRLVWTASSGTGNVSANINTKGI